jgi:hypothetical protein
VTNQSVLNISVALIAGLIALVPAKATTIQIGSIGVVVGQGVAPANNLVFFQNMTGPGCTTATLLPLVCDGINFSGWTAEVHYTDLTGAHVSTHGGPDFGPGNDPFGSPVDGSLVYPDNIITEVIFTVTFPTSVVIYDPAGGSTSTFFPQHLLMFDYRPSLAYSNPGPGGTPFDAADVVVSNAVAGTPEPGTLSLLFGGALLALASRRFSAR